MGPEAPDLHAFSRSRTNIAAAPSPPGSTGGSVKMATCAAFHLRAKGLKRAIFVILGTVLAVGCGGTQRRIADMHLRHGVRVNVTPAAKVQNLLGGSTGLVVRNVQRELELFPRLATAGRRIHIASTADLLRGSEPEQAVEVLFAGAATQDRPGPDQGDIYLLNKNLWGLYVDLLQPSTRMPQDPHLRHELMHAIEVDALASLVLTEPWQAVLDASGATLDELAEIDAVALALPSEAVLTRQHEAYIALCGRWLAAHFGDVTDDGRVDEADLGHLRSHPGVFDADADGRLTYEDAAARTGLRHTFLRGTDPRSQVEMTAGLLGYRPRGFASPYGRTAPWEDKAEVLDHSIRHGIVPHLYAAPGSVRGVTESSVKRSWQRLARTRTRDPILARKLEVLSLYLGNLAPPEKRNHRFEQAYGTVLVPFERLRLPAEEGPRVATARRRAMQRRMEALEYHVTCDGDTADVTVVRQPRRGAGRVPRKSLPILR